ncbi:YbhB/YbcL family Raf kinase inhibitor-like protein [Companilactobacillus keshanensis]|uniref:YbhB/YbcL family Raf kinase inhibitor-like protein n=1 Tax=Companilactobacillus keshanensis TaxID=2486003 RepID=A0ABW4BTD0_9LACO|nr:YbhB/YbcL family Raf kinase inhibitor-like protein [Companilactobacillus keshanensis]
MKINVALVDGLLPDKYGKYAEKETIKNGKPLISFPINLEDIPQNAKSLALTFTDPDSIPVCGFEWIHWTAANIPLVKAIPENYSQTASESVIQGKNSSASPLLDRIDKHAVGYNGPFPPDKTHDYILKVYALDTELNLSTGFWMNELLHSMENHIIQSSEITLPSRA